MKLANPGAVCAPVFPHFGAFESTNIIGSGTDILGTTRHIERWRDDLELLAGSSILDLRCSVPWHRIERVPGEFDFTWLDGPMEHMRRVGLNPIVDPLHHTSFPGWLDRGLGNPQPGATGTAETPGNDLIVSLGGLYFGFPGNVAKLRSDPNEGGIFKQAVKGMMDSILPHRE